MLQSANWNYLTLFINLTNNVANCLLTHCFLHIQFVTILLAHLFSSKFPYFFGNFEPEKATLIYSHKGESNSSSPKAECIACDKKCIKTLQCTAFGCELNAVLKARYFKATSRSKWEEKEVELSNRLAFCWFHLIHLTTDRLLAISLRTENYPINSPFGWTEKKLSQ